MITLISKPCKVMHMILDKAYGFCFNIRLRNRHVLCLRRNIFCLIDFFLKKHFSIFGLQITGGAHDIIFRKSNAHFKRTKLGIKFSLVEKRNGMPAVFIIHSRFGIPLRNLVGLLIMPEAGKGGGGKLYPERNGGWNTVTAFKPAV